MISNFGTENRTINAPLFRQKPQFTPVAVAARNVSQPARAITAAPVIRQVSTLYPDARFELVEKDRNNGFLYLFNGRYEAPKAMYLFLSMVTAAAYPTLEQIPIGKKTRGNSAPIKEMTKGDRETINKVLIDSFKRRGAVSLTTVKKLASEFRVTLPLFASTGLNLPTIAARLTSREGVTDQELAQLDSGREWPLASLQATGGNYNDKFKDLVASASPVLKFVKLGELDAWVLELTVTKGQAEFLTNSSWVEIRPMDLYGLIYEWALTYYGDLIKATPDYAIPLRQIAKSLDASRTTPRLSEDGLLVTERAEILALPRELDNVRTFEDRYASAYTQPNGAFGALDLENPTAAPRRPPKAMPVLIDWANLKFAYTTQDGRLQTRSLDRSRPVTLTHIVRFLERKVGNDAVRHALAQTLSVGSKWGFEYLGEIRSITELERAIEIVGKAVDEYKGITEIPLYEVARYALTPMAELPEKLHQSFAGTLTSFYSLCMAVLERIDAEPETAYAEYSVPTIIELRAFLLIFTKYAKDIRKLRIQDEELRKPYLEQPPETIRPEDLAKYTDPNMPLEAVPFANDSGKQPWGALPHQAKIAHLTASAPPNVILPVATGGGKSSIIIYDILREMGRGSKGPFLILCPSHLVSNYVREFVYFTNSEVNVIPVTNYTINRHGYERLQTMIEKAPVNTVLIADFNSIRNKASSIAYGVAPTKVFPAIEFLRQFAPQYVAIDESHYLRNRNARQDAVARLVSDIPKIRLASGTLVANVLLDLVSQFALMDPTLFGTEEDFIKTYAAGSTSSKVIYRDGAEQEVNSALRSSCLFAKAQKKEWAAILPFPLEQIHGVELSRAQKEVYQKIFEQSFIEAIKQDPARFSLLLKSDEDLTDREREERSALNLDGLMSQCLQRIESFLTAPGEDEGGALELKGDDLVSPKVRKIVDLCKTHLEKNIPGKILIFTNYNKSADAIDKALKAAGLGDMSIYYTATEKEKCGADFENNPKKKIMFGIENSMNTGLNLQYCFPGHTQIMTSKNTVMSLKDVFENPNVTEVLSYDLKNRKIEIKPILRKIRTRVKEVDKYVKIGVVDNKTGEQRSMVVTANHKIFMKGGGKLRADELTEGDQLITFGGNFEPASSTTESSNVEVMPVVDWLEARLRHLEVIEEVAASHIVETSVTDSESLTVLSVRAYDDKNVIGDFKYDIEVEGNHNYFALAGNEDLARQSRKGIPVLVSNCSRLIRCETVWTPGVLEQGNARIGRPNLKVEESRPYVYYDWVVALDTLDVTKISYLISKTISAAKFSEAGNERFDDIEVPPLFPMTLENIQNMNSWQETLPEYIAAYREYQTALEAEYADYREKAKDYLFDADGKRRMAKVPRAANPPGSALIRRVPYHPGTELYGQDQLGLVRYDQFLRQQGFNVAAEEDEFTEDGGAETPDTEGGSKGRLSPEKREQLLKENALVGGMWAHTEFGDGQIENLSVSTIKVRLDSSGELVSVDRLNCFLITRAETSSKDIRTQVLKLRGQVPLDAPIEVLESKLTPAKMKMLERERRQAEQDAYQQQEEEQANTEFEFRFSIVNDWLSIILVNSDNDTAVSVVQQSGFKYSPEYFYAEMRTPKMLFDQFQAWFDAGLEIPADYTDHLTEVYKRFKANGKKGVTTFMGVAKELEIRNFYKVEFKPDADANTIRPFPLIQDDILYIALPSKGHPGSKNAMRHKVPGVTWYKEEEGSALAAYTKTRNNAVTFFEHIESLGYTISNKADLIAELRTLKTIPAKPAK